MLLISYGLTRRLDAHNTVFGMSPRVAKHATDKQATCPLSHLHVTETRNVSNVSQEHLVAFYIVSEVAKLG